MSQEEEMLVIGRVTSEYSSVKKRLTALYSEASRIGGELILLGRYMTDDPHYNRNSLKNGNEPKDLSKLPTAESLSALFTEALSTMKRKHELAKELKDFGAEPKD